MADALLTLPKRCGKCCEVKAETEFHMRGHRQPGKRSSFCKECAKSIAREHRKQTLAEAAAAQGWKRWRNVKKADYLRAIDGRHKFINKYGITVEEYFDLFEKQDGCCALCAKPKPGRRNLAVDHCHMSGAVRALLCDNCNRGLGFFQESTDLLERAISYIRRHEGKRVRA